MESLAYRTKMRYADFWTDALSHHHHSFNFQSQKDIRAEKSAKMFVDTFLKRQVSHTINTVDPKYDSDLSPYTSCNAWMQKTLRFEDFFLSGSTSTISSKSISSRHSSRKFKRTQASNRIENNPAQEWMDRQYSHLAVALNKKILADSVFDKDSLYSLMNLCAYEQSIGKISSICSLIRKNMDSYSFQNDLSLYFS